MSAVNVVTANNPFHADIDYQPGNALAIELTLLRNDNGSPIDLSNDTFEFVLQVVKNFSTSKDITLTGGVFIRSSSEAGALVNAKDRVTLLASRGDLADIIPMTYYCSFNHIDSSGYKTPIMCVTLNARPSC